MNKNFTFLFVLLSLLFTFNVNAQVGIGTNQPEPSAQLEVLSNSKGLLIPRMTDIQRGSIGSPANGLLVYQTNNVPGFYFYNNGTWQKLASTLELDGSTGGGNSLLSGASHPSRDLGKDGDFYINTFTNTLFGPKHNSFWPSDGIKLEAVENSPDAEKNVFSASKLTTPRTINGVEFDGTKNIVITVDGTASIEGKAITSTDGTINVVNGDQAALTEMTLSLAENAVTTSKIAAGAVSDDKLDKNNIPLSGFGTPTQAVSMGGFKITHLSAPTLNRDAANKKYVDDKLADIGNLSLDNNQNLSVNGGNSVSLADLYQNLSLSGTVLSISGPRQSHVDLAGLLGNGSGGLRVISRDFTLKGNGTADDPLGIAAQGISADRLRNITNNGLGGQVLASDGNGGFTWSTISGGGGSGSISAILTSDGLTGGATSGDVILGIAEQGLSISKLKEIASGTLLGNSSGNPNSPYALSESEIKQMLALDQVENTRDSDKKVLSADLLTNPVEINGVLFDGSQDITIPMSGEDPTKQPLSDDLTKLANLGTSSGIMVRSADGSVQTRALTSDIDNISILDGNGVSRNLTLTLTETGIASGEYTNPKLTVDAYGRIRGIENGVMIGTGVTSVAVNEVNGFTASVSNPNTTTEISLGTSITGILEGNGGAITKAVTTGSGSLVLSDSPTLNNPTIGGTLTGDVSIDAGYITGTLPIGHGGTGVTSLADLRALMGVSNVDNTRDVDKPISSAMQDALDDIIVNGTPDAKIDLKGKLMLAGDLTGTADLPRIANGAINKAKIMDGAITDEKVNASGISGSKINGDIAGNAANVTGIVDVSNGGTGATNQIDARNNLGLGSVDNTSDLNKPISKATENALLDKIDKVEKGQPEGVATLDGSGKIPSDQLPSLQLSSVDVVTSEAGMLGLSNAIIGSIAIRTDINKSYVLGGNVNPTDKNDWIEILSPTTISDVLSVNGKTGAVILNKADIAGLEYVENTKDIDKPISTLTEAALQAVRDNKEDLNNKSQDVIADQHSEIKYPSVKATKSYIDNKVKEVQLAAGAVPDADINTPGKIQLAGDLAGPNSTYSSPEISHNAITTVKILDGNVTDAKLAPGISGSKITGNITGKATGISGVLPISQGGTGATDITGAKAALGLGAVDNTSDMAKPVSTATKTALDALRADMVKDATTSSKGIVQLAGDLSGTAVAPKIADGVIESKHIKDGSIKDADIESISGSKIIGGVPVDADKVTGTVAIANGGTGATTPEQARINLGLGNVSNLADANKPISNDTKVALDDKEDKINKVTVLSVETADGANKNYPSALAVKSYVDAKLPEADVADVDKVLTVNSNGDVVWDSTPGIPSISNNTILGNNSGNSGKAVALDALEVKTILGLNNVQNLDQTNADNIAQGKLRASLFADSTVPLRSLNTTSGTPDATTFLRGDGQWTAITGGGGSYDLPAATSTDLGGVIVGDGLVIDGAGKISTKTDLGYTGTAINGEITSSTGLSAEIPGVDKHAGRAGLMFPEDKTKLDKIPEIISTDADKVLTVNAAGTAAEWKEVAPASGGGSEGTLVAYHPGGNKNMFIRATANTVSATLSGRLLTIIIPAGVRLDYFKISTKYTELGNQNFFDIKIVDEGKLWNNSIEDVVLPIVNVSDVMDAGGAMMYPVFSPGANMSINVMDVSDGILTMQMGGLNNRMGSLGFYVTIRP